MLDFHWIRYVNSKIFNILTWQDYLNNSDNNIIKFIMSQNKHDAQEAYRIAI